MNDNTYTVKQIADMLNTNEETVRRWIRTGKLTATQTSKKIGNVVTSDALKSFARAMPKYAPLIKATSSTPMMFTAVIATMIGGLVAALDDKTSKEVTQNDVKRLLERKMQEQKESINKKAKQIKKLQDELEKETESLANFQYTLDNLDLSVIVEELKKIK